MRDEQCFVSVNPEHARRLEGENRLLRRRNVLGRLASVPLAFTVNATHGAECTFQLEWTVDGPFGVDTNVAVSSNPPAPPASAPASFPARGGHVTPPQAVFTGSNWHRALQQLSTTGPRQVVGGCVQRSGYPSSNYGVDETFLISGVPTGPIRVMPFDVEAYEK
eukprot:7000079-Prymnesium_polylepis.1